MGAKPVSGLPNGLELSRNIFSSSLTHISSQLCSRSIYTKVDARLSAAKRQCVALLSLVLLFKNRNDLFAQDYNSALDFLHPLITFYRLKWCIGSNCDIQRAGRKESSCKFAVAYRKSGKTSEFRWYSTSFDAVENTRSLIKNGDCSFASNSGYRASHGAGVRVSQGYVAKKFAASLINPDRRNSQCIQKSCSCVPMETIHAGSAWITESHFH